MADRVDFYSGQRVTEAELGLACELLEQTDRDLAADIGIYGIGTGAALAIAEASARRFGGRLETGDSEDGGALVAIVLPRVQPDATDVV